MKLPVPRLGLLLLCVGLILGISVVWTFLRIGIDTNTPVDERLRAFPTAIIGLLVLGGVIRELWCCLFQGYSFFVWGETLVINVTLGQGKSLVIGPLSGLEGKALLLCPHCACKGLNIEKPRSFQIHKEISTPDIIYNFALIGHDGANILPLAQEIITQSVLQARGYRKSEPAQSGCLEIPVVTRLPSYSLRISVAFADDIEERFHAAPLQLKVRLNVGVAFKDFTRYSTALLHTAEPKVMKE